MRWIIYVFLSLLGTIYCSEEESNEVIIGSSIKPPVNLDSNLRKALLKALVELENEEKENYERNTRNDYVNILTHLDTKTKSVEKAPASAISFFSKTEPVNMTVTVKKTTSKPKQIVVIQKSNGTHHKTFYGNEDLDLSESPEQFIASASSSFTSSESKSSDKNINNKKTSKTKTKKQKYEQTTTTAKPTSSTEENEANVESLQFFSAPLVAAFTVHQDEKGLPRSVVPIYNSGVTSTTEAQLQENHITEQQNLKKEVLKQQKELEVRQEEELRRKQKKLEEEIRRLTKLKEEQERIIKEQRLSYERKIFEHQKKLFEEQTRLYNNVHPFVPLTTTQRPIPHSANLLNNPSLRVNKGTLVSIQPSVGFVQPTTSSLLPLNAQILPIKNAVDFRTPFGRNFGQFPVQNNNNQVTHLGPSQPVAPFVNRPQNGIQNAVPLVNVAQNSIVPSVNNPQNPGFFQKLPSTQQNTFFRQTPAISQNSFLTSQNLPFVPLQTPTFKPQESTTSHRTRNLRQESGTGNFLNNNRLNNNDAFSGFSNDHRFHQNSFSSQPVQNTQFYRPNFSVNNPILSQYNTLQYSVDQPIFNQRLNNLLYNSGLGRGRQQEDLNIVSKVLSLNHIGGNDPHQFANSNVHEQRLRTPSSWRVV